MKKKQAGQVFGYRSDVEEELPAPGDRAAWLARGGVYADEDEGTPGDPANTGQPSPTRELCPSTVIMVEQQAQDQMYARHVRWAEMNAIGEIEDDPNWGEAVQRLVRCVTDHGTVILTGMGKIGYVCQRVASTMSSVGIPAIFLHPGEAVHGDLGFVRAEDIVLACSNSGKTEEVLTVVQRITDKQIIVCVGDTESPLAQLGLMLTFGKHREPDPLNVAPSASIAAMSAVLDALTFCVQGHLNFTMEDYAHNHHAGYLGRKARGEEK